MYHNFSLHSSPEGHIDLFQVLSMTNHAAINIVEHMYLLYELARGNSGSWAIVILNFLRNGHTDFKSGPTTLYYHQEWRSVPFSPHALQHRLSLVFLILAILAGVRWYLRVVLSCISLIAKDFEHFLKCLSAILDSSVENSLFSSVPHF